MKKLLMMTILTYSYTVSATINIDKIAVNIEEGERIAFLDITNGDELKSELVKVASVGEKTNVSILPDVFILKPGMKQTVKFIIKPSYESSIETLDIISIKSSPEGSKDAEYTVYVNQKIPLKITPSILPKYLKPWELLEFKISKQQELIIKNPSDYLVRIFDIVRLNGEEQDISTGSSMLLPRSEHRVKLDFFDTTNQQNKIIEITPIGGYGNALEKIKVAYNYE